MSFDSLTTFLEMGRHGLYVWTAYGATAAVLALLTWHSRRSTRRFFARQRRLIERRMSADTTHTSGRR